MGRKAGRRTGRRQYAREERMREYFRFVLEADALEVRLGLVTDDQKAAFYGDIYLDPWQRLSRLYKAAAERGV